MTQHSDARNVLGYNKQNYDSILSRKYSTSGNIKEKLKNNIYSSLFILASYGASQYLIDGSFDAVFDNALEFNKIIYGNNNLVDLSSVPIVVQNSSPIMFALVGASAASIAIEKPFNSFKKVTNEMLKAIFKWIKKEDDLASNEVIPDDIWANRINEIGVLIAKGPVLNALESTLSQIDGSCTMGSFDEQSVLVFRKDNMEKALHLFDSILKRHSDTDGFTILNERNIFLPEDKLEENRPPALVHYKPDGYSVAIWADNETGPRVGMVFDMKSGEQHSFDLSIEAPPAKKEQSSISFEDVIASMNKSWVDGDDQLRSLLRRTKFNKHTHHIVKEDDGSYVVCKGTNRGRMIDNEYGPAVITKNGMVLYYKNGKQLITEGFKEQQKYYYKNPSGKDVVSILDDVNHSSFPECYTPDMSSTNIRKNHK